MRKTVLDQTLDATRAPVSSGPVAQHRIPESHRPRLTSGGVAGPAGPWPQGHSYAIPSTLGRAEVQP